MIRESSGALGVHKSGKVSRASFLVESERSPFLELELWHRRQFDSRIGRISASQLTAAWGNEVRGPPAAMRIRRILSGLIIGDIVAKEPNQTGLVDQVERRQPWPCLLISHRKQGDWEAPSVSTRVLIEWISIPGASRRRGSADESRVGVCIR